MKNIIKSLALMLSVALIICAVPIMQASASTSGMEGEWYYYVENGEATVTPAVNKDGVYEIPSTIAGYPVTGIGDYAFVDHSGMTELIIPEGIKRIGKQAFANLWLENITLPSSLESIGEEAFYYCDRLKEITIPEGIKSISDNFFAYCESLETVKLPESLESIGNYAFAYCESLVEIIIPDGIASIEASTFVRCESLTTINLPDSITVIGDSAFYGCTSLETVYFSGTEEQWDNIYIGWNEALSNVTVICSDSAELYFRDDKFSYTVKKGEATVSVYDGGYEVYEIPATIEGYPVTAIADEAFAYMYGHITEIIIPEGIKSIGKSAFAYCSSLKEITLPESLETVGEDAFMYCNSLTEIVIPKGVTSIGAGIFYGCDSLETLTVPQISYAEVNPIFEYYFVWEWDYTNEFWGWNVPETLKTVTTTGDVTEVYQGAFWGCEYIESIYLPETVKVIGNGAFSNCKSLKNFTIPESVETIYAAAFNECAISTITIPKNVSYIGGNIFSGCSNLTELKLDDRNEYYLVSGNCLIEKATGTLLSAVSNFKLPDNGSVKKIEEFVFDSNSITEIIVPDGVESIGNYAFIRCSELQSVTLPESLVELGDSVFADCTSLKSIELPDNLEKTGEELFERCEALETVKLPKNLKKIENYTFHCCYALKNINIPNNVTEIGEYTFNCCENLKSVTIPAGVSYIGKGAFADCVSLVEIKVDANNEHYRSDGNCLIGDGVLIWGCGNSVIPTDGSVTSIGDYAFCGADLSQGITIPYGVERIGIAAFQGCKIDSVVIPDSVTKIGQAAFLGSSLENAVLPKNLTWISAELFAACGKLKSVVIPEGVTGISGWAFAYGAVENIVIPNSVKEIGYEAFAYSGLKSIDIGSGAESIDDDAFWYCEDLTEINVDENNETYCSEQGVLFNKEKTELLVFPQGKGGMYIVPDGVENFLFGPAYGITSLIIPEGITEIGMYAAEFCESLNSVYIPASVTYIDNGAFEYCSLNTVYFGGTQEQWNEIYVGSWNDPLSNAEIVFNCEEMPPDVNGDRSINADDVTIIRKALLERADSYDINRDGDFNIIDLVKLKKQVAGIK